MLLSACRQESTPTLSVADTSTATADSLRQALADRDSVLALMNEITYGMEQIKQMENLLVAPSGGAFTGDSRDRREQIRTDMQQIQQSLQQRRDRLAELERKLKQEVAGNETLRKSIEALKSQIAEQEAVIEQLRSDLSNANLHIARLNANIDSLNTEVTNVAAAKDVAEQTATTLNNELNLCHYAIGSKRELNDHKLISSGFLRKTKILPSDFEQSYFTTADKRTLNAIDLHSTKAKVLTNQPEGSYTITTAPNGNKVLRITDPARFWSLTNFLIIQID